MKDLSRRDKLRLALEKLDPSKDALQDEDEDECEDQDNDQEGEEDKEADDGYEASSSPCFRRRAGQDVQVHDVDSIIPVIENAPFSPPVRFPDRLGVFLSDGATLPSGQYPSSDDGKVKTFPVAFLFNDTTGRSFRVHARSLFHGKAKFSFVEVAGPDGEMWYGRVWLLFSCLFRGHRYNLALVSWLDRVSSLPFHTSKPTFRWSTRFLDCIELGNVKRTVTCVPSFITRRAGEPAFHLLD